MDDNYFAVIDTEEKAYILGWIASDSCTIGNDTITIETITQDLSILDDIAINISIDNYPLRYNNVLRLCSPQMVRDVCRHLNTKPGKKAEYPFFDHDVFRHFVRGVFDGHGYVSDQHCDAKPYPVAIIINDSSELLERIKNTIDIPSYIDCNKLAYVQNNAFDFLARLYDGSTISLDRKRKIYGDWCSYVSEQNSFDGIKCVKTSDNAVLPAKQHASDAGFDLTIIKKIKQRGDVSFYTTGIKVQMPSGWYCHIYPRSSISKTGYMLANSVGIIDRGYSGEIIVALRRVDERADELQLPMRIAQLVPTPSVHMSIEEVESLDKTVRGDGGFGSTGN